MFLQCGPEDVDQVEEPDEDAEEHEEEDDDDLPEAALRAELLSRMEARFLNGLDSHWVNYEAIDNDDTLDMKMKQQDREDKYFSEDEV